jgi:phage terminase small subunit
MDASVFGMGHPVTATPRPSSKKPPTPPDPLAAPAHLSAPARELWRAILKDYQLEPHHMATLQKALEAFDRAEQARDIIAREGLTVEGRYGSRPNPCVSIERDSRAAFLQGLRQLHLDLEGPPPSARRG